MTEGKGRQTYAVVDLEATGTGSTAKIIQIGIVLVKEGRIVREFASDINPYETLDYHIQQLTGISDEQLAQAPAFSQVAPEIFALLEEAVFVAHNVTFDANLLAEALFWEGFELRTPRVDTVELAQVFFPTFEKYSLESLAKELSLPLEHAHTAISDAVATAHLLQKIQEKILSLPLQTIEQVLGLADNFLYESRLVIDDLLPYVSPYMPEDKVEVSGLVLAKPVAVATSFQDFSTDFEVNRQLLGLEGRPEQAVFAKAIQTGLQGDQRVQFIQAPAGIGKTYGYLLPLLAVTEQPLLVLVPTKILQEQILQKEGRALQAMFGTKIASMKSSRHYIDLAAFWRTLQAVDSNRLLNRCKMQVLIWLTQTLTGDMTELQQKHVYPSYFDEVRHAGTIDERSVFAEWDFWYRALQEAQSSRVLLTNHAFFLQHVERYAALFDHRILIVDEVQKMLVTADQLAHHSFDLEQLAQTFQSKADKATLVLQKRLLESCHFEVRSLNTLCAEQRQVPLEGQEVAQLLQNLQELSDAEFADLQAVLESGAELWLEKGKDGAEQGVFLRSSQSELLDLGTFLSQQKIFGISAGLIWSGRTDILDVYGFSEVELTCLPMTPSDQQTIFLPTNMPAVLDGTLEDHVTFLREQCEQLLALGLPTLILFTSKQLLLAVSDALEEHGLIHLAQYRHGSEDQIKRRFDRDGGLLLGTGLFWEGMDFSSHEQMVEVIVRLPFANPKDSFVQKMTAHLRSMGKSVFSHYTFPMMLLKLSQALGRTRRSAHQTSAVLLLDPRVTTKQYGNEIIDFLSSSSPIREIPLTTLYEELALWKESSHAQQRNQEKYENKK